MEYNCYEKYKEKINYSYFISDINKHSIGR